MKLTPEQRDAVSRWIAAGDSLAQVQRRLADEFKLSLTYMEVRFIVDDLGLELKSPAPVKPVAPPPAPVAPPAPAPHDEPPAKKGLFDKLKDAVGGKKHDEPEVLPPEDEAADAPLPGEDFDEALDDDPLAGQPASGVTVEVDRLTRPGTLVSGTVTFSDGVSGKWAMDQFGRLMLDAGKGYKPPQADIHAFQTELSRQLQKMGY